MCLAIDERIRDEVPYNVNREDAKVSALLSGKIGKYKYLTDEEMHPDKRRRSK